MDKRDILGKIRHGLIVSCQALEDEPLHGSEFMSRMALAARVGGAAGIRANGGVDIIRIKESVDLPVIGIVKKVYENSEVYITPTIREVEEVCNVGAEIVAFDATLRQRPDNMDLDTFIKITRDRFNMLIMADISTIDEGINAWKLGVDIISTTLSGYTSYSPSIEGPDFNLVKSLAREVDIPIIAEGRIWSPEEAAMCIECGAYAVVVGGAITRPQLITKRFVDKMKYAEV